MSMTVTLYQSDESGGEVPVFGNTSAELRAALTASATLTLGPYTTRDHTGAIFMLDITQVPGSASTTVALKLQALNPASGGRPMTVATLAARGTSGVSALVVYPGVTPSAGSALAQVSFPLPKQYQLIASFSTGATSKDVVFSLGQMNIH